MPTAVAGLTHEDARRRDLAAAELGDLLRAGALDPATAETVVAALVALTADDPEPSVQESALHAIAEAFDRYQLPLRIFRPLRRALPVMPPPLIEYILYILSATHDPDAGAEIEPFLSHPDPAVRRNATQALTELRGAESEGRLRGH